VVLRGESARDGSRKGAEESGCGAEEAKRERGKPAEEKGAVSLLLLLRNKIQHRLVMLYLEMRKPSELSKR